MACYRVTGGVPIKTFTAATFESDPASLQTNRLYNRIFYVKMFVFQDLGDGLSSEIELQTMLFVRIRFTQAQMKKDRWKGHKMNIM